MELKYSGLRYVSAIAMVTERGARVDGRWQICYLKLARGRFTTRRG
jgi:hypothetical protein